MSGIVAMFSEAGAVRPDALTRATRSLAHRGPDDHQTWIDPARSVGLGHARLGTGERSGGAQPVISEDGAIRAVVDGALHDAERVRGDLCARGHRMRGPSDAEIVVHLYEQHGAAFVEHLRGEFAFALYDGHRDLLIAGRDRCGARPVVYGRHAGALILASEAKALLAAGLPAAWDVEAFLQCCVLGGPLEDATMFAGVQRIPPGHLLIASRGHTRLVRYWDFDYPLEAASAGAGAGRSEADDRDALAAVLDEAVGLRLRADAPVACYLGGLDASTVFGLAHRRAPAPLQVFTVDFGRGFTEEQALAHDMAIGAGAQHTRIALRPAELAGELEDVLYFAERPLANASCALTFQLARGVRAAGFQRVLTGDGSDELFAGYAHFRPDLAHASQRGVAGPRVGRSPPGAPPPGPRMSIGAVATALDGFSPAWLRSMALSGHGVVGLLRPEHRARLVRGEPFARFIGGLEVSRQLRGRHPLHQSMYLWSKSMLANYTLSAVTDAMHMAHGVECRLPYLDHRVIELSTRLPIDRLIRGDVEKYLLREAARAVVPEAICRRPKDRVVVPEAIALERRLLDELLHDTLRSPRLAAVPLFEPASVAALLDSLPDCDPAARARLQPALMLTLTACLLHQRFAMS